MIYTLSQVPWADKIYINIIYTKIYPISTVKMTHKYYKLYSILIEWPIYIITQNAVS